MLAHRLRRWATIEATLGQCVIVFAALYFDNNLDPGILFDQALFIAVVPGNEMVSSYSIPCLQ